MMNWGFCICVVLLVPFIVFGILFATLREKAAVIVSGFNTIPKEERNRYDRAEIARDMRNQCFIWSAVMFAGAMLSFFISPYCSIPALIIWLVLFLRQVKFDTHKAFDKYLKQ